MLRVGLTGNFGMGKSLVLETFGELGAFTIDADEIVHGLFEDRAVLEDLRRILGDDAFDSGGNLIREKVADKIFRDESLRMDVEDILHPLVFEKIEAILSEAKPEIAVVEATLIFERGHEGRFDRTVAVVADDEIAVKRLEAAGVPREEAMRRLVFQMPAGEKAARADYVIDNSGSPEETRAKVKEVYGSLMKEVAAG